MVNCLQTVFSTSHQPASQLNKTAVYKGFTHQQYRVAKWVKVYTVNSAWSEAVTHISSGCHLLCTKPGTMQYHSCVCADIEMIAIGRI